MKTPLLFFACLLATSILFAQADPNWSFLRTDNTGIGGLLHYTVKGDAFDNIWTGGYTSTNEEGSLVRISVDETVYTNWGTYSEEYLPNGLIYDIEFDSTGIIWVGTAAGITTSSDGLEWNHYDTSNSALIGNTVTGIAISGSDEVWLVANGTSNGVASFNGTDWQYFTATDIGLPGPTSFSDIAIDSNNNKWVATADGLLRFDGTDWVQYNTSNSGLSANDVEEIAIDDQGQIWVLVGNAIDIFDGTNWTSLTSADLPVTTLNANTIDVSGSNVLISNGNFYQIIYFDGSEWQVENTSFFGFDAYIDNENNYWISGSEAVAKFDGTDWTKYTQYNTGLPSNFNEDVFIDSQGRYWFANGNGGIQVFDCPNWEVYGPNNEGLFPNPQPLFQTTIGTSITEDADGDIWFTYDGTSGYAIQIPGGNYQDYASWVIWDNTNSTPSLQFPEEVEASENGEVFIRQSNGLPMYDKNTGTWTVWNLSNGLTGSPTCLARRSGGAMYVGHFQGIDIYNNGTWTNMDLSSQGIEYIHDIRFDANDMMWLGTSTGLWKFDGTEWTNWTVDNSNIAATNVTGIDFDADNNIYISAHNTQIWPYYGGISYFDGSGTTFTTFLAADSPLAHKQVEDIEVDAFGNIWSLTQSEGFSIYNPNGITGFECIDRSLERLLNVSQFENSDALGLLAHPNPTTGKITLEILTEKNGNASYEVHNLLGQRIANNEVGNLQAGRNTFSINLENNPSGIYFCSVTFNDINETIKLIKK